MEEKKNVQTSLFGLGPEITQKANPNNFGTQKKRVQTSQKGVQNHCGLVSQILDSLQKLQCGSGLVNPHVHLWGAGLEITYKLVNIKSTKLAQGGHLDG